MAGVLRIQFVLFICFLFVPLQNESELVQVRVSIERLHQRENIGQVVIHLKFGRHQIIDLQGVAFLQDLSLLGLREVFLRIQHISQPGVTRLEFFQPKTDISLERMQTIDCDDSNMLIRSQFGSINFDHASLVRS